MKMNNKITCPADLPIHSHKDQILEAIENHQVIVVAGETGSGKTTQLPKICLEAGRGGKRVIGCTQPRRIAATSVAMRVAEELGEANKDLVGYKIRFHNRTTRATRIKFMTDGILLAEAQQDRFLNAYDTIIVDEAHERSLNIDFLLGLLKRLLPKRRDLKLIITSATIDTEKFSKHFGDAPVIEVSGRGYPVEVRYHPIENDKKNEDGPSYVDQAVAAVLELRKTDTLGDMLVFMPTERDIRETVDGLSDAFRNTPSKDGKKSGAVVMPLFGRLAAADQRRIFNPVRGQKIVVATNVAETSITVPGIRYVVDTGLARIVGYNVRARTTKMPVTSISRASCDQRKGRCGRVGPGICVRLFSEEDYANRHEYTLPEVQRSNLAEVILRMIALHLGSLQKFPFIDPPSSRAVQDGYNMLLELGAIDQNHRLTGKGRLMARLPLDPGIARMIIEARDQNALREVSVIAAALSINDPRVRPADKEAEADAAHIRFSAPASDFLFYLKLWDTYRNVFEKTGSQSKLRKFCKSNFLAYQRMREWRDVYEQISMILEEERGFKMHATAADYDAVHRAVLSGNLRNIALKKAKNFYQGAQGKEVMIFPGSSLFNKAGEWIMAAELVETTRLYARTVATIKPEWIEPLAGNLCRSSYSSPHWEKRRGQVVALEKVTLFGLVIVAGRKVHFGRIKPDEARHIFIQSALVEGEVRGSYGFLKHNRKLLEKFQDVENRIRQREIVVDDHTLFRFYDERLPLEIVNQADLNRMLKKRGADDSLRMFEEDILQQLPEQDRLTDFPDTLRINDIALKLSYKFEPGSEDDGVTVDIPLALLRHVKSDDFEWLVPGMLLEKIIFLLKGLPKGVRKRMVPIPGTAAALQAEIMRQKGGFYQCLGLAVSYRFGVEVTRSQWRPDALSNHLRMRFLLLDNNKIIKISRDFTDLNGPEPVASSSLEGRMGALKKKWERENIVTCDFDNLPDRIPVTTANNRLKGFVYPTLVPDIQSDGVSLRLYTDPVKSCETNKQGMLILYRQHFRKHLKAIKKDCSLPRSRWGLYEGIATHEEFHTDLSAFILENLFGIGEGGIHSQREFSDKIIALEKKGIYAQGRKIFDMVVTVLEERRAAVDLIRHYENKVGKSADAQKRFSEHRKHLERILPVNFLQECNGERLTLAPRYLKALRIRIERQALSPAKDAAKAAKVVPHEDRLQACEKESNLSEERKKLLDEYRQMLEEYRVSLFAQELKTVIPVSAKRLERKWRELERA